jgi:polysaccharide export outer membrane protein
MRAALDSFERNAGWTKAPGLPCTRFFLQKFEMPNRVLRGGMGIFLLWVLLLVVTPSAQELPDVALKAKLPTAPQDFGQALERSIDPETYVLGPGDMLQVDLWGELPTSFQAIVTPEGTLLLPTVGAIEVAGVSLSRVKERVRKRVLRHYRNVEVTTTLMKLRNLRISVTGAVKDPGVYVATSTDRISQLIEMAGGFIEAESPAQVAASQERKAPEVGARVEASKRRVSLLHRDRTNSYADLLRFQRTGDLSCNPVVRDGDVIYVPVRDTILDLYGIFGAVKAPSYFEYAPGDRLSDLVALAQGLKSDADSLTGEIVRFDADHVSTFTRPVNLSRALAAPEGADDIPLLPDDRVYIRSLPRFHEKQQVTIVGEVRYPGTYAIEEGKTSLSELVQIAGGVTAQASLDEAVMIRADTQGVVDPEYERLKRMNISDMDDDEYRYFKIRSLEVPGKVSVNLGKLLLTGDKSHEVFLRDGDHVTIPRISRDIKVVGLVNNPGSIALNPGKDYRYYIDKAGGLTSEARKSKIRIIERGSQKRIRPRAGRPLEPGQTVWVPEKPKRDYWRLIRETVQFVGSVATVYLVVQQATE